MEKMNSLLAEFVCDGDLRTRYGIILKDVLFNPSLEQLTNLYGILNKEEIH